VILIGIDDTDVPDSKGTNQLARAIVAGLAGQYECIRILRHQLLDDPRVPYTSKNGSASIALSLKGGVNAKLLLDTCRRVMQEWYVEGSDPGLCLDLKEAASDASEFGRRCQQKFIHQQEARSLAQRLGLHLEGLGGTEGGVIGALAAVGLAATGNDGRIVQLGEWPDDLTGWQPVSAIWERGVEVRQVDCIGSIQQGLVDLGKRLRPNFRDGEPVLFVQPHSEQRTPDRWQAVRLP
jgi:hypothetical protein